jgi:hypothetical protein
LRTVGNPPCSVITHLRGQDGNRPLLPTAEQALRDDPYGGQLFCFRGRDATTGYRGWLKNGFSI